MLRKLAIRGVATFLLILTAAPAAAADFTPQGKAALLLDGATGQILYQQNKDDKNYPASTTKLLTALVAVEHGQLQQKIKVSASAVDVPPDSSMCYLQEGEEQTLENLLYGLLLASGNDCANAIAEGVSGANPAQFIQWMNETAVRLGAVSSHFTNAHGYHEENHYTSANDLAIIARGALTNPAVRKIAGSTDFFWPGKSELNGVYHNHNQMLFTYPGAIGGKTGFTEQAGLTLVTAAERDGRLLIGVVMGEQLKEYQYGDMNALLDLGFSDFTSKAVVQAGNSFGDVPVAGGMESTVPAVAEKEFRASAPLTGSANVVAQAKLDEKVTAPISAGQPVGVVEIKEDGRLLGTVPLVAKAAVAAKLTPGKSLLAGVVTVLKWLGYLVVGLVAFRLTVKSIRRLLRRFRKRNQNQPSYRPAAGQNRGTIDFYRTRNR